MTTMKRILILLSAILMVSGCGLGYRYHSQYDYGTRPNSHSTYPVFQDAALVFLSNSSQRIEVAVDNQYYRVKTVRNSSFRSSRYYKKTNDNAIIVRPGRHHVTVRYKGRVILDKRVNVYPGDMTAIYL